MKYIFCLLLFAFCFSCDKSEPAVQISASEVETYLIGYTGGWGGSAAYKLESGQLYRSVEDRNLGFPDDILNDVEFRLLDAPDKLQAMTAVMADYPATVFDNVTPKFDCAETAYDGACPYLIVVTEKGESKAWTASEFDDPGAFIDYMDEVKELLSALSQ